VSRKSKMIVGIGAVLLTMTATKLTVAFVRYARVESRFSSIRDGDSRDSVISKLGKPNYYRGRCGVIHVPLKNCSLEFVYSHPFAPMIPEYQIISFSMDDHVIEAEDWKSP
jgi:hypothetical protein